MSRAAIIQIAEAEVGYKEPTKNVSKYNLWFGFTPAEWCAMFCSWCYAQAGHPLGIVDFYKGFASVPFAMKHWHDRITTTPKLGDLVLFDWNGDKAPDHVGLFVKWIDKDTIQTIEGNTSDGNPSDGGCVQVKVRKMAVVECFIDPLQLP